MSEKKLTDKQNVSGKGAGQDKPNRSEKEIKQAT
jgi:hypothetical protein